MGPAREWLSKGVLAVVLATASVGALSSTVPPERHAGLLALYEANRLADLPNWVTEDLMLVGYALVRQETLAGTEDRELMPRFTALLRGLHEKVAGTDGPGAVAQANRDYLAVLVALLDGDGSKLASERARNEFALARSADGIATSPLWGYPMDYSQLKPRGRYTASEALTGYFRALRYAGLVLFAVQPSRATGVTEVLAERMAAQALALTRAIEGDAALAEHHASLDRLLAWEFGRSEDLRNRDLLDVAEASGSASLATVFVAHARQEGRIPSVLYGQVDKSQLEENLEPRDVLVGWRLLPARYTAESAAFQGLVHDATGDWMGGAGPDDVRPFGLTEVGGRSVKGYPRVDELLAMLGSAVAGARLDADGERAFERYAEAFASGRERLLEGDGLNGAQLRFMARGLASRDEAQRRDAMHAFWVWQRYLGVLYTAQSNTLSAKGLILARPRAGATIEPSTSLYLGLRWLVEQHRRHADHPAWKDYGELLERVVDLSTRVAAGGLLDEEDERFLNDIDTRIKAFAGGRRDGPVVVDVHTNPADGMIVEEATGLVTGVFEPTLGRARGGRLSPVEFKRPIGDRLTVEAWRELLAGSPGEHGGDKGRDGR